MEIILPSLAERLKPLRKSKSMTQKAMAELLDCTERHYQKIEYGQINVPAFPRRNPSYFCRKGGRIVMRPYERCLWNSMNF